MTGSRSLLSDNHRMGKSVPGTYLYYAKLAARNERSGSVFTAEALWLKARRRAESPRDHKWADNRAAVCRMRMNKWEVTA